MEPVTLRTARLELSLPVAEDAAAITSACQDPEIPRWTTIPSPYGLEDAARFIERVADGWDHGDEATWAVRRDSALIGMIGLHHIADNVAGGHAEIGFWIADHARGNRYVTEAASAVLGWGFAELGLARVEWRAVAGNIASARTAHALGFRYEGVLRHGHATPRGRADAWIAGLLRTDDRFPSAWPVFVDMLVDDTE